MKDDMFNDLLKSAKEADIFIKKKPKFSRIFDIHATDIKNIRRDLGVTQFDFAFMIGVSINTLQNWEQERRNPHGPALALLTIFKNNPKKAFNILHSNH